MDRTRSLVFPLNFDSAPTGRMSTAAKTVFKPLNLLNPRLYLAALRNQCQRGRMRMDALRVVTLPGDIAMPATDDAPGQATKPAKEPRAGHTSIYEQAIESFA